MPFFSYNSYAFPHSCDWYPAACRKGPVTIALGLVGLHAKLTSNMPSVYFSLKPLGTDV